MDEYSTILFQTPIPLFSPMLPTYDFLFICNNPRKVGFPK